MLPLAERIKDRKERPFKNAIAENRVDKDGKPILTDAEWSALKSLDGDKGSPTNLAGAGVDGGDTTEQKDADNKSGW